MNFETYHIIGGASLRNLADSLSRHPSDTIALPEALAIESDKPSEEDIVDSLSYENRCVPVHLNDDSWTKMSGALGSHCMGVVPGHARPGISLGLKDYLSAGEILNKLKPRIEELSQAALEEESEGQLPLSNHSLQGLTGFLNEIIGRGLHLVPSLVLTYEGEIRAEWRHSSNHRLALEFINSTDLEFVFFYPNPSLPEKTLRTSGSGSVTDFLDDQPKALELLRGLNRTSWKSIFFDMYHPHQEKTSETLGATRPAGGFLGDYSGAGEASRRFVA